MFKKIEEWIYLYDTWKVGKNTTIMVWVHWNELSWIKALNKLKNSLKIDNWKVYFIFWNLKAIKKSIRFTEKNLNRCFLENQSWNSYEEKRAKIIMKYLDKSDYLLDIHNTINYNNSLKVLITTHIDFAKYFNIKNIMANIDSVQKWGSDGYMDNIWKKWFCLECGSINFKDDTDTDLLAEESIINFLKVTKNIEKKPKIFSNSRLLVDMYFQYKTKTDKFRLSKDFKDFDKIKKWEIIWIDWEEKIICEKDSIIVFSHNRDKIWEEWFYLWEKIIN